MVTREQIEKRILSLEDAAAHYAGSDAGNGFAQDLDAYRLALAHLDSERARRVGEAVIASGVTAEWCAKHLRDLHNAQGSMSLSSPAYGRAFTQEIALFSVLAEALRGEP